MDPRKQVGKKCRKCVKVTERHDYDCCDRLKHLDEEHKFHNFRGNALMVKIHRFKQA